MTSLKTVDQVSIDYVILLTENSPEQYAKPIAFNAQ